MQDNLKEHIDATREDFELYPFDTEEGWEALAGKVAGKPRKSWNWISIGKAASIGAVIAGAIFFFMPKAEVNNELAELEQFYTGEIDHKMTLIKNQLEDDRILSDLAMMDEAFAELKGDLKENVDNEEVVAAMMENYRLKLRILEEILNELEKEGREENL